MAETLRVSPSKKFRTRWKETAFFPKISVMCSFPIHKFPRTVILMPSVVRIVNRARPRCGNRGSNWGR